MSDCVFATGVPFIGKNTLPATLHDLAQLMPACAGMRRWGAASLDLAYVAAGRFDGFWERELKIWDIAAGLLLVREAGGFTGPIRVGDGIFERGELIAANAEIFDRFAKIIRARPA
jgi:myo-inositol-1(or 4)-monophosphatase